MKLFIILVLAVATASAASLDAIMQPGFPEGRIINGQEAVKGAAPYIVSLKSTSEHYCAGSIIDKHWVVTAAHCLKRPEFDVIAGLHHRNDESDVQIRKVTRAQYIVHEKYGGSVGPNDIGLIYVPEAFNLNALSRDGSAPVAKINLPSGKYEETGKGIFYGWGRDNSATLPYILQTLNVDIIGYEACKAALPSSAKIHPLNICSYNAGTTDGPCHGDSGGPLVNVANGETELVGIASWVYVPCTVAKYPSVYTMVSAFKPWIAEKINNFDPSTLP